MEKINRKFKTWEVNTSLETLIIILRPTRTVKLSSTDKSGGMKMLSRA